MFYIKDEGFDEKGRLIGPLYHEDKPAFTSGMWVNLEQATRIAKLYKEEVEVI